MHTSRILAVVGFALALIGAFLPWASVGDLMSASGFDIGNWWLPVALLAPGLIMSFLGTRSEGFSKGKAIAVLVLGIAATAFMIYEYTDIKSTPLGDGIGYGLGLHIVTVGSALGAVAGFLGMKR